MVDAPAAPPDPKAAPAAAAPASKFGKKKLIIIAAVAVVVLLAGGIGAYFAFSHQGDETADEQSDEGADAKDAKAKPGKKDKTKAKKPAKPKGPAIFVKLEPPFVVNFEAKGLMRFLQVSAEIMTRDPETAEILKQNDPMIRNDLLLMLSSQTYETISTTAGKEQIRAQALKVVSKVVTTEGGNGDNVEQLYFTSFVMQ